MAKHRDEWRMSNDCRRPQWAKETFLKWIIDNYSNSKHPPSASAVVKEARKKSSPLHNLFEWDVNKAARRAWLDEAGYLLRHVYMVKVEVRTNEIVAGPVRAFPPVSTKQYGRRDPEDYVHVKRVARSTDLKSTVLERAHQDFLMWLDRYKRYAEFLDEFSTIVEAYERLSKKQKAG